MPTYNGWNIVTMPSTPAPKSIEPKYNYIAGASTNPLTGQQQVYDWQASYTEMGLTFPPMVESDGMALAQFLVSCQGVLNVFQLPASISALLPTGVVPGGYWRLSKPVSQWSINEGLVFGLQFDIREAI